MKNKFATTLLILFTGITISQEYPVKQPTNKINNSPWYGLGESNIIFPSTTSNAIQLAGYYGLFLKTGQGDFTFDYNGRLGIGTTAPTENLSIYGNSARLSVSGNSGASAIILGNRDSYGVNNPAAIYAANGHLFFGGGTSWNQGGTLSSTMAVTDNGKVGIGTSQPSEKFEIYNSTTSPSIISLKSSRNDAGYVDVGRLSAKQNNTEVARIGMPRAGETKSGYLTFWTKESNASGLVESMRINANGNIGIGTTNPEAKLEVYEDDLLGSNINDTQLLFIAKGKTHNKVKENIWLRRGESGADWYTARIHNGISIDNSFQSPGINTKTWWERDPKNNIQSWGTGDKTYMSLKKDELVFPKDNGTTKINATDNYGSLSFGTGGNNDNLYIKWDGKIGVGTTTPDSELSVNGNIHTKEVKVDLIGWPDFVFEKDYNLPTLKEVENQIKEKGHLKNIPSAAEVEKNGIFLGEMNAKLLQKIEELTLYTIQQQKEIELEKSKNTRLEQRLLKLEKIIKEKLE